MKIRKGLGLYQTRPHRPNNDVLYLTINLIIAHHKTFQAITGRLDIYYSIDKADHKASGLRRQDLISQTLNLTLYTTGPQEFTDLEPWTS